MGQAGNLIFAAENDGLESLVAPKDAEACRAHRQVVGWTKIGQFSGQLYRRLGISRAEKMVFVTSAAKVAIRDLKSNKEAELELLCSAVAEEPFGTAMVDCVLISESS